MKDTPANPTNALIEGALQAYFELLERGEAVEREAFLSRYPEIADALRNFIAAEEELRKLAGDRASRESATTSTQSFASQVQETVVPGLSPDAPLEPRSCDLAGRFGRYRIIRVLGQGAMGTVYLAEDLQIQRLIALKTPHFTPEPSEEQKERFFREARAAGNLRHANICPVHDFGQVDGRPYISMAYIEGRPLSALMLHRPFASHRKILTVIRKLAHALQEAHDHGIVHRDLKPSNIIVDTKDEPIITDFGLAHESERGGDARLTRPGISIGTPAFMSPEQVQGDPARIGPATDQYSLGVIIYEWLTGRLPFEGPALLVMSEILSKEPIRPRQLLPTLDPRIEALCLKMLAKPPSDRFASMVEVADEISTILDSLSDEAKSEESVDDEAFPVKTGVNRGAIDDGSATRISHAKQLAGSRKGRIWIRWAVASASLAALGLLAAVIVIYLGKTAVIIDIKDPGVQVALNGTTLVVTGPSQQSIKVEPGEQQLTITFAGLETTTRSFTVKKGEKKAVTISILNSELVAQLDNEITLPASARPQAVRTATTTPGSTAVQPPSGEPELKTFKDAPAKNVAAASRNVPAPSPDGRSPPAMPFDPFVIRGEWSTENDELVQPTLAAATWTGDYNPLLVLGDETLANYDLSLEVKKTGGRDKIGVVFHWLGPGHYRSFGVVQNREIDFSYMFGGKAGHEDGSGKDTSFASNVWYSLKLEIRGSTFLAFLDGALVFQQMDSRFTHGRVGFYTNNAAARFRRIKLNAANGKVLFEGLPPLPPAGRRTAGSIPVVAGMPTESELAAKNEQQKCASRLKTPIIVTNAVGIKLALIPPGAFRMGSPESEKDRGEDEQQHDLRISQSFRLGVYEITQSQFDRVTGRNPSVFSNGGGQAEAVTGVATGSYPVDSVDWYDAVEFCNRLSEMEALRPYYRMSELSRLAGGSISRAKVEISGGTGYRLPSEAEWEYACRSGTTTPFNFGAANDGSHCNCNDKGAYPDGSAPQRSALGRTIPVGSYRPNALGLFDMHGNVWEWCWDTYNERPQKGTAGAQRVNRGGSWGSFPVYCRSAVRGRDLPTFASDNLGFRIARSLEQ
jgi:serine/threonine protein kinase/formylglycine-generating enzyme required for sulfatase activity